VAIWMMGIVLGWLYYYSQNLWVSIIAHFLNNFSMIALKFAFFNGVTTTDMSETTSPPSAFIASMWNYHGGFINLVSQTKSKCHFGFRFY
jgi:membrane protease YdiL (CAAX protease family)